MHGKPFYQSKTIWFNALALLVMLAGALGFANFQADPQWIAVGTALLPIINIVLRFSTAQPITVGAPPVVPPG